MFEELDCAAITTTLKPLHTHIDDLVIPFQQAEAIDAELRAVVPHDVLDFLVLAWHHDHLFYQSQSNPKRYHHREREFWLTCAEGLLGKEFDTLKALVFDKLDSIVWASSLVEMVNGLIRPYFNSCKGQITQEALNLIMFYHNYHRYKSGKRQGKAPIELLTGKPLEAQWWELLLQHIREASQGASLTSSPPLELVSHRHEQPLQSEAPPDQAISEPSAEADNPWSPMDAQAA